MTPALDGPCPPQDEIVPRLAPPPRRVPASLAARALLGPGALAWLWLALGAPSAIVLLAKADVTSWAMFRGPVASLPGVATACEDTGDSEGGGKGSPRGHVYATRYRYGEGGAREGVSYATGRCVEPGTPVVVEHPAGRPEVSRIQGMRRATFGPDVAIVAVFPIAGVVMVAFALRSGWRELRLLRHGKLALGALVGEEATGETAGRRRVMKLRFAIDTDRGLRQEVVVKTSLTDAVQDEPRERILYDPRRPARAVAWDLLRCSPRLDGAGALRPERSWVTLLVLSPPALAVACSALALRCAAG